jgi:histidinol-phosphate/aromatic aminotransferase/cobyric acid decarboxylase-like protein
LLLINPDNPSGNYISSDALVELAGWLLKQNKKLNLDESFVDFFDIEGNPSLLKQTVLDTYQNLIVIKSLSKSYGIRISDLAYLPVVIKILYKKSENIFLSGISIRLVNIFFKLSVNIRKSTDFHVKQSLKSAHGLKYG